MSKRITIRDWAIELRLDGRHFLEPVYPLHDCLQHSDSGCEIRLFGTRALARRVLKREKKRGAPHHARVVQIRLTAKVVDGKR